MFIKKKNKNTKIIKVNNPKQHWADSFPSSKAALIINKKRKITTIAKIAKNPHDRMTEIGMAARMVDNLQNRKFCLSCSPFKEHNTKDLNKKRFKYTHSRDYQLMSPEEKKVFNKSTMAQLRIRRLDRKSELILSKGGCCQKCGYKKNYAALQFHHRNPKEKLFGLDVRNIGGRNLQEIVIEVNKCDLLCANCHAEHHHPHFTIGQPDIDYQI